MPRKTCTSSSSTSPVSTRRKSSGQPSALENDTKPPAAKKVKLSKKRSQSDEKENDDVTKLNRFAKVRNPKCSLYKYCSNYEMGLSCQRYRKPLKDMIINYCRNFQLYKVESPFDRRVTCIVWHPENPRLLSVTSHGGDVILYNYEQNIDSACLIEGIGAGGSVQGMKFDPLNPVQLYTASMEGKFLVLNFDTKEAKQFLETNDINRWFVSVDVNAANNLMVAGDTKGNLTMLTIQGKVIQRVQLHKKNFKVNHAEFSKREPWLLCTSSNDCTIKLWDIRNLKAEGTGMAKPLQQINHDKPLNAAYFSLTDGCRLLTTDQFDKIKIYKAPFWDLETVIRHPHRQFQHLTPIKAYWHPLEDIVFVGRYPHEAFPDYHENELRTIDFFDADTGDLLYQHFQSGCNGILSLNMFNVNGDALASSYGHRFMIWKPDFKNLEKLSKKQEELDRLNRNQDGKNEKEGEDEPTEKIEIDWNAILKKQSKDKKAMRSFKKKGNKSDEGDEE